MLITTAATLALAAPTLSPAHAVDQTSEAPSGQGSSARAQAPSGGDKIDVVSCAQEDLYAAGWTAEQLFEQPVYGANGEEAGEVENLLIGPDGELRALIVESGGFLDIADTHYRVPWEDAQVTAGVEGIRVPVTADNVEQYSVFPEDEWMPRGRFHRIQQSKRSAMQLHNLKAIFVR